MTRPVLHNCHLPNWIHRTANGAIGGLAGIGIAMLAVRFLDAPFWTFWLGAITALGGILLPRQFSLVEGCAGDLGYDELDPPA